MTWAAVGVGGAAVVGGAGSIISGGKAAKAQNNATNAANTLNREQYNQTRDDQAPWRGAGVNALGDLMTGFGHSAPALTDKDNARFQELAKISKQPGWTTGTPQQKEMEAIKAKKRAFEASQAATANSSVDQGYFNKDFGASDFQEDPGYQFRMSEGQKALERSAAARGGLNSGGFAKALTRYGQDTASSEYQNAFNRFNSNRDSRFNRLASLAGMGQVATNQLGQAGQSYASQTGQNMTGAGNAQAANYMNQGNAVNGALGSSANALLQYNMMNKMFPAKTGE